MLGRAGWEVQGEGASYLEARVYDLPGHPPNGVIGGIVAMNWAKFASSAKTNEPVRNLCTYPRTAKPQAAAACGLAPNPDPKWF